MGPLLVLGGATLVALGMADLIWTTLAASGGGGPLTSRLAHLLWEVVRVPPDFPRRHQVMRLGGLVVIGATVATWVVSIWVGWTLIFSSDPWAVVSSTTGQPATWWGRFYFVGTTISTLGLGDLIPPQQPWRVLAAVASMNGLLVATLAITYLVPVISAVTHRRQVALQISGLGGDPFEIAARSADPTGGRDLARHLEDLTGELHRLAQQHLTYPALHYFHDVSRETAGPVQVAVLDEALTLIQLISDGTQPIATTVDSARAAVRSFLATLTAAYIAAADEPPAVPDVRRLRALDVAAPPADEFRERMRDLADHRAALLGFVEDDGWRWDDVYPDRGGGDTEEEAPRGSVARRPEEDEEQTDDGDDVARSG